MDASKIHSEREDTETPGQKQARLRRARREAKVKSEGSSRLEKITKVSGRQNLPEPPLNLGTVPNDPDEVDLSTHPSLALASSHGQSTEADLRAMLRAGAPQPGIDTSSDGQNSHTDPMMSLLSGLLGGSPQGVDGNAAASGELPPGLAAMLGGAGALPGIDGGSRAKQEDSYAFVWKVVHAVCALCLGVYITATSTALSSSTGCVGPEATAKETTERQGVNLFFVFATLELLLQSSRFFLEKRHAPDMLGGWVALVAAFLPEPWRGYLRLVGRYARIWGTVVEDAMVIIFVIGCFSWWKGAAG